MTDALPKRSFRVVLTFPDLTRRRAYPLPVPISVQAVSEAEAIRAAVKKAKRFLAVEGRVGTVHPA